MGTRGIDVSRHQGNINWGKIKEQDIKFAIIRASCSNHKDAKVDANVAGCIKNGIDYGFYHTLYAKTIEQAKKEANLFLESISPYAPTYPVYVDIEFWDDKDANNKIIWTNRDLPAQQFTDMVITFCEIMEKAGYYTGIYANRDFFQNHLQYSRLTQYDCWLAEWVDAPSWKGNFGLWQNKVIRGTAQSMGVQSVDLDLDVAFKDYPTIIRAAGLNKLKGIQAAKPPIKKATTKTQSASKVIKTFHEGDKVKVLKAIDYDSKEAFTSWYPSYEVLEEPKGSRAVIGKGGVVTSAIDAKNIQKI